MFSDNDDQAEDAHSLIEEFMILANSLAAWYVHYTTCMINLF